MRFSYDVLLFDLDGTLTDSQEGIFRSIRYALAKVGAKEPDPATLRLCIGPPLLDSFQNLYHLTKEQSILALHAYRERYRSVGLYENRPYEGIGELLAALSSAGFRLMVATSKPEDFSRRILEHFSLAQLFECVCGPTPDGERAEKPQVIDFLLKTHPEVDPRRTLMIGDRKHDVLGAAQCGLDCVGVLYGFGDRAELEAAGAKYIVSSVEMLGQLLFG